MEENLNKLIVRVERTKKVFETNAPDLIKINELNMIKLLCEEMIEDLKNKNIDNE